MAKHLIIQKPKDKNKLYSLHAPEVECISKGKSRNPYEFGVKASVVITHKEGLVIGMRTMDKSVMPCLPYSVQQVTIYA